MMIHAIDTHIYIAGSLKKSSLFFRLFKLGILRFWPPCIVGLSFVQH